ncbi:MAG TPA: hypothetical protein DG754_14820 [Bacteroidales bacterium]|nr:hypothetical protein [Bacteroidales bacterium]
MLPGLVLFGQVDTVQFRNPQNYPMAVSHYSSLYALHPTSAYYPYQMACYLALQGLADRASVILNRAIDNGAMAEDIYTDTDFEALHHLAKWCEVDSRLKQQFLDKNSGITHPDLAVELWLMGIEDQRYRTLRRNYKKYEPIALDDWKGRVARIEAIVTQYGWPKISMVGETGAKAAFLIIQHSDRIKKYLPHIINAANEGEAKKEHAAMMIDRSLCFRKRGPFLLKPMQIYGTQFYSESKFNKNTGNVDNSPMKYYPICNPANLDLRRAYIGRDNFEEDCKRFGVHYPGINDLNKNIRIKKRWIRKGYLLGFEKSIN